MTLYRRAVESDLSQVIALLREIMEYHKVVPPDADRLSACVATIIDSDDHVFLVADEHGRLLGMCALLFSMSTWAAAPVCEIQDLIVSMDQRGDDVGRNLIDAAGEIALARGCTRFYLLAEYWNLQAHAFYRSVGLAEKTCLDFERDLHPKLP
jgi:N-acetylglutamate synthase-like GNAT family acetyltransferase